MSEVLDTAGQWCLDRLLALLAERPDPAAYDLASLRPVVEAWYSESAPGIDPKRDMFAFEVARQTGTDEDNHPMDPPVGLDPGAEWFSVAILRNPGVLIDGARGTSTTVGLDLWWPPSDPLQALRADPAWDTGNLLGFDCLGTAGAEGRLLFDYVDDIFAAFGNVPPAAAVLVAQMLDEDVRLL